MDDSSKDKEKYVMISYNWDVQTKMLKLKEFLASNGIKIWMDVDDMGNKMPVSMADAVENAALVLVAMTEKYQSSDPCYKEANYAEEKKVPIVPLLLQRGYKPAGWLGFLMTGKKYVNLSTDDYKQKFGDVLIEINRLMNITDAPMQNTKPAVAKPTDSVVTPVDKVNIQGGNINNLIAGNQQVNVNIYSENDNRDPEIRKHVESVMGTHGTTKQSEVTSNNQFERMPENSVSKIGSTTASEKPCQTFTDIFTVDENGDSPEESNASIPKETYSSATSQPPSTPQATSNTAALQINGGNVTVNYDNTPTFVAPTPDTIKAGIKELETGAEQQTGTSERPSKASQEPSTEEKTVSATKRKAADDGCNEPAGESHPRTKIPKTDGNSSNEPGDTKKGPQMEKCSPSTLKEYANYAARGRIEKLGNSSTLKPHIIMSNLEKFIYEDNAREANAQRTKFFKQIKYQSSPSAEDLDEIVKQIRQNKNPVRAALFHTAAAFQHIQDNTKVGNRSYAVSGYIYKIFDLVLKLTSGRKSAEEVLDFKHLKKGAQAKKIAKFLVPLMQKLYEVGCAEDNEDEQTSRKAYALRWIAAALRQIDKYDQAIKMLEKRSAHYGGVQNESEVNIRQTLGLCYEKKKRFDEALTQMKEARSLAHNVEMKDKEKTMKYLDIFITRISNKQSKTETS